MSSEYICKNNFLHSLFITIKKPAINSIGFNKPQNEIYRAARFFKRPLSRLMQDSRQVGIEACFRNQ